jgi:hypothetical protein
MSAQAVGRNISGDSRARAFKLNADSLVDEQDELAADVAFLAEPMRLGTLGKGERAGYRHGEHTLLPELHCFRERMPSAVTAATSTGISHAVLLGLRIGDGDHLCSIFRDLDQVWQRTPAGSIERGVYTLGARSLTRAGSPSP